MPLLASAGCWALGNALRDRSPSTSLALVILSATLGGFGLLLLAAWFLPAIGG